jgi:hypothetical protein
VIGGGGVLAAAVVNDCCGTEVETASVGIV